MYLPTVLRIQRVVELTRIEPVGCALVKRHGKSHQEISQNHSLTCSRSVKGRCAYCIHARPIIQPLLVSRTAEPELVRSLDPADIVNDRRHWSIVLRPRRRSAAAD